MGIRIIKPGTEIPFTSYRNIGAGLSFLAIVGSIFALMTLGLNFGIDFRGGIAVEVGPEQGQEFAQSDLELVRSAVRPLGLGEVTVSNIGSATDPEAYINVFVERQGADSLALSDTDRANEDDPERLAEIAQLNAKALVIGQLRETLGENIEVRREDVVGPTVSGELIEAGITALAIAIGMMLVYIWFRFEWQFSLGAILALAHDIVLTLGFFAITQLEFSLAIIAALLTIVGYSMNDTVVVFDRVRENLRKFKKKPLAEVIDLSINQTLARTLMTSLTTLVALGALLFLGGQVLRGFSIALVWGVVIGTYSSVFIASPLLLRTGVKRDWSKQEAKPPAEAPA